MVKLFVDVNTEDLRRLKNRFKDGIQLALRLTAGNLQSELRKEAPKRTTKLATSFIKENLNALAWHVFSRLKYSIYVARGTGIYAGKGRIYPKHGKFLKFTSFGFKGKIIFARSVKGQKANKYDERAIRNTSSRIQVFMNRAIARTGI